MFFFICELHLFNLFYCFQSNKSQLLQYFAHVPCILQHFAACTLHFTAFCSNTAGISNVGWNQSVVVRIPVVTSSPTYNISMHLVYNFVCNKGECLSLPIKNEYIGMTTLTLKERLKKHTYAGAIYDHFVLCHGGATNRPKVEDLLECTKILYFENNPVLLHIFEALHIKHLRPNLNNILEGIHCLKLNMH